MERTKLDLTPETINAMHDAVGALVFVLVSEMPPERRDEVVSKLARLARSKSSSGAILAGTLLLDFATAADFAAKNPGS